MAASPKIREVMGKVAQMRASAQALLDEARSIENVENVNIAIEKARAALEKAKQTADNAGIKLDLNLLKVPGLEVLTSSDAYDMRTHQGAWESSSMQC